MKLKDVLITVFLCAHLNVGAQIAKSYMRMEILSPANSGPITGCAQDTGLWEMEFC